MSTGKCLGIKAPRVRHTELYQEIVRLKEFKMYWRSMQEIHRGWTAYGIREWCCVARNRFKILRAPAIPRCGLNIEGIARGRIGNLIMVLIDKTHTNFPPLDWLLSRSFASIMSAIFCIANNFSACWSFKRKSAFLRSRLYFSLRIRLSVCSLFFGASIG